MTEDRRHPFDGVTDYFSELARLRMLGVHGEQHHGDRAGGAGERTHASAWVPATDIRADGDDLLIQLELPGVPAAEVDLRLSHGVLTVSGTRPAVGDPGDFYVHERYVGEFRRSITLPEATDPDDLVAEVAEGVVEVRVRGAARGDASTQIRVADRSADPSARRVRGD